MGQPGREAGGEKQDRRDGGVQGRHGDKSRIRKIGEEALRSEGLGVFFCD